MKRIWLPLAAVVMACGGDPAPEADLAPVDAPAKPWVQASNSTEALRAGTAQHETIRYVADSGVFSFTSKLGGRTSQTFDIALEMVALRVGDLPTLDHPVGFLKFNPLSVTSQSNNTTQAEQIVDLVLRNMGAPVQLVYDVHSVGDMQGRLVEPGSAARGRVVGTLQIDARQEHVTVDVLFERRDNSTLVAEIVPFELDLTPYVLGPSLTNLAKALGVRAIDTTIEVSGSFELTPYTQSGLLPTFVRTPITVNTVNEIRERLDAEIDDFEAHKATLRRQGVREEKIRGMTREAYEAQRALTEKMGLNQQRTGVRR